MNDNKITRLLAYEEILNDWKNREPLTKQKLAYELKNNHEITASTKTIQRDIQLLKSAYEAPIENNNGNGYYLAAPWTLDLEISDITGKDVYAIALAAELASSLKGTPLYKHLNTLSNSLKNRYEAENGLIPDLTQKIEFLSPPASPISPDLWDPIITALCQKCRLRIRYSNVLKEITTMDIAPGKLACIENEWYLFSIKKDETMIRQLALRNMAILKLLPETFSEDFQKEIRSMIDNRFGWFASSDNLTDISVTFDKAIAYILVSRPWHKFEEKTELTNGDIKISFPVAKTGKNPFLNIRKWILGYAPYIKEISPEDLKNQILKDLAKAQKQLKG